MSSLASDSMFIALTLMLPPVGAAEFLATILPIFWFAKSTSTVCIFRFPPFIFNAFRLKVSSPKFGILKFPEFMFNELFLSLIRAKLLMVVLAPALIKFWLLNLPLISWFPSLKVTLPLPLTSEVTSFEEPAKTKFPLLVILSVSFAFSSCRVPSLSMSLVFLTEEFLIVNLAS